MPDHSGDVGRMAQSDTDNYIAQSIDDVVDLDDLLTEHGMSGDIAFLEKAKSLYPDDPSVVVLSALWADSEDSEWLDKLESLQPSNALPNVIRASFYAKKGRLDQFSAEMEKVMAKPDLNTGIEERLARKLDGMLQSGRLPNGLFEFKQAPGGVWVSDGKYGLDSSFSRHAGRVTKALFFDNADVFVGEDIASSTRLDWAKKLQSMPGLDWSYRSDGMGLELRVLNDYGIDDVYGSDGMTVGGRMEEIRKFFEYVDGDHDIKFNEMVVYDNSNSVLKRKFFARLALDGERAARNWLVRQ